MSLVAGIAGRAAELWLTSGRNAAVEDEQWQYRTSDRQTHSYLKDRGLGVGGRRLTDRLVCLAHRRHKESDMQRKLTIALAMAFVLESTALPASALAYGGGSGGHSTAQLAGGRMAENGNGRCGGHACGLRGRYEPSGHRDVWDHWGNYYGPMIHVQ